MAEHLYEVSLTKTTGAAAGFICTIVPGALGAGIRPPEIREIGITNVSGVAAEVGIGIPAAAGVTPSGALTVQPLNQLDPAGHTQLVPTYTTAPTAPANPYRRFQVQALAGAGDIFTWLPGEFTLWSGAAVSQVVLWQFSASAVTYDVYVKVAE